MLKTTDSSFFLGQGANIVQWPIWDLILEHPLPSSLTTWSLHARICTYTHTHNLVMHTPTLTHHAHAMPSHWMPCTSLSVSAFPIHRLYALPDERSQTPLHQTHSYLSFCSQLIDQFLWEAFLNHPRKVLVPSQCSLQHHILYNITQHCDYNFPCCFF